MQILRMGLTGHRTVRVNYHEANKVCSDIAQKHCDGPNNLISQHGDIQSKIIGRALDARYGLVAQGLPYTTMTDTHKGDNSILSPDTAESIMADTPQPYTQDGKKTWCLFDTKGSTPRIVKINKVSCGDLHELHPLS